jgi:hypothetical protein
MRTPCWKSGLVPLNQTLAQSLKRRAPAHLELIDQPVAMLDGTTSATVLAAALDRELVSVEPIGDQYKVLVEVALQALFFDFRERQVIASYPLTLQRIDVQDYRPDNDDIDAIVADLLYGSADTSLSQVLAASLAQARLPDAAVRRLQVGGVPCPTRSAPSCPTRSGKPAACHAGPRTVQDAVVQYRRRPAAAGLGPGDRRCDGRPLCRRQGLPAEDSRAGLRHHLQVDALKNGVIEETPAMKTMLFGAFFTAKVTEPFSGKVYFEQPLRKGPPRWCRSRSGRSTSGRPATKPCWPASTPSPAPPPSVPIRALAGRTEAGRPPVAAADPSPPGVDQVMSLMRTILLILIALVVASPVAAQTASSRGTGSASYGLRLSADTRAQALNKAKVNALEAYIAETGAAKLRLFEARRAEFIGEIDRYVLSAVQLSDTEDKKAKTYTVTVRAEINTTLLQTKLDAGSAVAGATAAQRSLLTFLFMARSQDTVQSFQDKEYRRVDASSSYSENTREGDSFRGNSVSTNGSINQNGSVSVTSGGSTTQRSDNITWKVANAAEVNTAMTGAFSAAGYEVVEAEYVEGESRGLLSIERIRKDFSTGNDLAPATLRDTANGIRAANIPYIAVGTLDVGMRDRDPASGNTRVFVTVTGKVLDVTGRFPRTVSSVGPVQFSGTGPNETVARTNALQLAAEKAAQQMINELNVKAVR